MVQFKYAAQLQEFQNCPPSSYSATQVAWRWVHSERHKNDFLPVNIISDPPQRILDDEDLMCKGYGLSMFSTYQGASEKFKYLLARKRKHQIDLFLIEMGGHACQLTNIASDGVSSKPEEKNHGHFTFHEFEAADLYQRITELIKMELE